MCLLLVNTEISFRYWLTHGNMVHDGHLEAVGLCNWWACLINLSMVSKSNDAARKCPC